MSLSRRQKSSFTGSNTNSNNSNTNTITNPFHPQIHSQQQQQQSSYQSTYAQYNQQSFNNRRASRNSTTSNNSNNAFSSSITKPSLNSRNFNPQSFNRQRVSDWSSSPPLQPFTTNYQNNTIVTSQLQNYNSTNHSSQSSTTGSTPQNWDDDSPSLMGTESPQTKSAIYLNSLNNINNISMNNINAANARSNLLNTNNSHFFQSSAEVSNHFSLPASSHSRQGSDDMRSSTTLSTTTTALQDTLSNSLSNDAISETNENNKLVHLNSVSLLFDPPIQSCTVRPHVSITDRNGNANAVAESNFQKSGVRFSWFRGLKRLCVICGRNAQFQCLICANWSCCKIDSKTPDIDTPNSYFCSLICISQGWKTHRNQMHNSISSSNGEYLISPKYSSDPTRNLFPSPFSSENEVFIPISQEMIYTPQSDDIGCSLKLVCQAEVGKIVCITSPVMPMPSLPPVRSIVHSQSSNQLGLNQGFSVMCYNILADSYASRTQYPYTPSFALNWEYRQKRILGEIERYKTDIICLQEVQSNHNETVFKTRMTELGYDGVYKSKTRDPSSQHSVDGCAIYWRIDRFAMHEQYGIEFDEAAKLTFADKRQLRRAMKGNIALVVMLEELQSIQKTHHKRPRKRKLCIANCHLHWDPQYSEVKLWQAFILTKELEKIIHNNRREPANLVLCGDFNSLPDSSVYELLSSERIESLIDDDPAQILPIQTQLNHRLGLQSAYASCGSEPLYTNFTAHFVGVLDYIFYTRRGLRCMSVFDVDSEQIIRMNEDGTDAIGLPNSRFGSDHLPLIADFDWVLDM